MGYLEPRAKIRCEENRAKNLVVNNSTWYNEKE